MFWKTRARYEPGKLVGAFLFFYGLFRFGVEFIREPDQQLIAFTRATGLHMGQWLSLPMILARPLLDAYRQGPPRADRTDGGHRQRRLSDVRSSAPCASASGAKGRSASRPIWRPATLIITQPATRSARPATSSPRPRSARCSANWSARRSADCWKRAGAPADAVYAELGPGRGTLAADALRVLRSSGFAGEVHFVETSPVLREAQKRAVPNAHWHDSIAELPERPLLLVANEFLDALPIRQFVAGIERRVTVVGGGLAFDRDGEIVEVSPARDEAVSAIAAHLAEHGGIALLIDYGHERTAPGDTLQAVSRHRFASILEAPGEQDLTSHVDFEAVAASASKAGAKVIAAGDPGRMAATARH